MDREASRRLSKWTLVLVAAASVACTSSAQGSKPIVEDRLIVEFVAPPPTLNEMIFSADLVVVGRLTAAKPHDDDSPGIPHAWLKTLFTLKVRELLHVSPLVEVRDPNQIPIERKGGERDRGDHVERVIESRFPAFQVGEEYVLFLRKFGDVWRAAYGPDSAFRISDGHVTALGSSAVARAQHGKTEEEFLRAIRNLGK